MSEEQPILEVYKTGPLTVVGFGGKDIIHDISVAPIHDEVVKLVEDHGCKDLAFDLTGVKYIPSGLLGIMASLRRREVQVHVYNPSDDVCDVLDTTGLNKLIQMHDVDVSEFRSEQ